jgi:hypothetical protein
MSDKSTFRITMVEVKDRHGPLSSRECEIAETAARTAYSCAYREMAKHALEVASVAGG